MKTVLKIKKAYNGFIIESEDQTQLFLEGQDEDKMLKRITQLLKIKSLRVVKEGEFAKYVISQQQVS